MLLGNGGRPFRQQFVTHKSSSLKGHMQRNTSGNVLPSTMESVVSSQEWLSVNLFSLVWHINGHHAQAQAS